MDALIAEHLDMYVKPFQLKNGDHFLGYTGEHHEKVLYCRPFSTDIAAAWEVVEKIKIDIKIRHAFHIS